MMKKKGESYFSRTSQVTLKEHFETRFEAMDKAVELAHRDMERRLEGMNEFRAQLTSQANTFLPRQEYSIQYKAIEDKMDTMESRLQGVELLKAEMIGRIWTLGIVTAIIVIIMEAVVHYVVGANLGK